MKNEKSTSFTGWVIKALLISVILVGVVLAVNTGIFLAIRANDDYKEIASATSVNVANTLMNLNDEDFTYDEADGVLKKGDVVITDDAFKASLEFNENIHHTIFWGDTRVLTDVTDNDGNTAVGTKLTDETIISAIEKDGIYNANDVLIYGSRYSVCYYPLKNGDTVVGYVFTGVNQDEANGHVNMDVLLTVIITIVYSLIVMLIISKLIKKRAVEFDEKLTSAAAVAENKKDSVSELGNQTNSNMEQINVAVGQMSQAVTSQASHTQEIMSTMEAFGDNIDGIMKQVTDTNTVTKEGTVLMGELEQELVGLENASKENSAEITNICEQIDEDSKAVAGIEKIIKVIDDISFQITILSFNASVEAARAGDAGLGFAVVAESIKELSDKTQASVNEISGIIGAVSAKIAETGKTSEELMSKNTNLVEELARTKKGMGAVTESFDKIAANISRVQEESQSIIVAKDEVISTVSSLAASSEENAAMSEEISATSNLVITTTGQLLEEIRQLKDISDTLENVKKDFA